MMRARRAVRRETREVHPTGNQVQRKWRGMAAVAVVTVGCIVAIVSVAVVVLVVLVLRLTLNRGLLLMATKVRAASPDGMRTSTSSLSGSRMNDQRGGGYTEDGLIVKKTGIIETLA